MYDSRIARWLSVDPFQEFWSPYEAMGNNPVSLTDPNGGTTDDWYAIVNANGDISYYQVKGQSTATDFNKDANQTYFNVGGDELTSAQAYQAAINRFMAFDAIVAQRNLWGIDNLSIQKGISNHKQYANDHDHYRKAIETLSNFSSYLEIASNIGSEKLQSGVGIASKGLTGLSLMYDIRKKNWDGVASTTYDVIGGELLGGPQFFIAKEILFSKHNLSGVYLANNNEIYQLYRQARQLEDAGDWWGADRLVQRAKNLREAQGNILKMLENK